MKNLFLFLVVCGSISSVAHASTLKCVFENPFVEVNYSTNTREITINSAQTISNVSLHTTGKNQFALLSQQHQVLVKLQLTNAGSDGHTNMIYPYSAEAHIDAENKGLGACESDSLPAQKPEKSLIEE